MLGNIKNAEELETIIKNAPEGKNTKFLSAAHSLWFRFKNYDKHPPFVLYKGGAPVAFVFATYSDRSKYINLYEIVTMQGQEGKGYAREIWEGVMQHAYNSGMKRLKISCTPDSVTWHNRNGLIFWAVDPSGSLRSDQPLFPTVSQQREYREYAINRPLMALPKDPKTIQRLKEESLESHGFGPKKTEKVKEAIKAVGDSWLRTDFMIEVQQATLEKFM
jgi:hypothetical protein